MKPGPKGEITAPPLHLSSLPKSGSARVVKFIERYCRTPKGTGTIAARSKVKLLDWQTDALVGIYDDTRPRQALISISRKNGKTFLAACLALYHLLGDGEESAEVVIASSDERTAMITFNLIRRMVELEPRLSSILHVHKDRIYHPPSDSVIEVLSGDASRAQGRNPSLALLDECHVASPDMWDALALGMAARKSPLMLGISTEGPTDPDNLMTRLVEHGRTASDPDFYFQEHVAPLGCAVDDEAAWAEANPGLGHTVTVEHLRALVKTTREQQWRRYHLNQRVAADGAWLGPGVWDACAEPDRKIRPGSEVVLALDGSFSGDCTGIVVATISPRPHLDVVGLWQPSTEEPVDILEVEERIRQACKLWRVREVAADPYRWSRSLQILRSERINAVVLPQSAERMTPATTGLYEALINRQVTHSGNADLALHAAHAVVKEDSRGTRISKPSPKSPKRIDLAVCAVMAHARATALASRNRGRVKAWR